MVLPVGTVDTLDVLRVRFVGSAFYVRCMSTVLLDTGLQDTVSFRSPFHQGPSYLLSAGLYRLMDSLTCILILRHGICYSCQKQEEKEACYDI